MQGQKDIQYINDHSYHLVVHCFGRCAGEGAVVDPLDALGVALLWVACLLHFYSRRPLSSAVALFKEPPIPPPTAVVFHPTIPIPPTSPTTPSTIQSNIPSTTITMSSCLTGINVSSLTSTLAAFRVCGSRVALLWSI